MGAINNFILFQKKKIKLIFFKEDDVDWMRGSDIIIAQLPIIDCHVSTLDKHNGPS